MTRAPRHLTDSVHRRLNMYALAACAAGVGAVALVPPAEGKIVYTRANKRIPTNTVFDFDLNRDRTPDFEFSFRTSVRTSISAAYSRMRVGGLQRENQIWEIRSAGHACAAALPKNTQVGPRRPFRFGILTMFYRNTHIGSGTIFGPWFKTSGPSYLGLKFVIKGKTHFAWARVGLATTGYWSLISYAYETIPNKPIITGRTRGLDENHIAVPAASLKTPIRQPATLGALALGAPGLAIWKREESAVATPQRN